MHCRSPIRRKKRERAERLFEKIKTKSFPNLMKDIAVNVQEKSMHDKLRDPYHNTL